MSLPFVLYSAASGLAAIAVWTAIQWGARWLLAWRHRRIDQAEAKRRADLKAAEAWGRLRALFPNEDWPPFCSG